MSAQNALTPRVFLFRHGETDWAKLGRSTGTTEIELNPTGEAQVSSAAAILVGPGKLLDPRRFEHIFVSPRKRARQTFELLLGPKIDLIEGIEGKLTYTEDIAEWNYGDYEGLKNSEIRSLRQERGHDKERRWDIWTDGCEGGEYEITERLDRLISQIRVIQQPYMHGEKPADVLLVAHGLILRCFTKRWIGLPIANPLPIMFEPGAISVLSYKNNNIDEPALHIGLALPKEGDAQEERTEETTTIPMEPPSVSGAYKVNEDVVKAFPVPNTKVLEAFSYGNSIYGKTAKIVTQLPTKEIVNYFLKTVSGGIGRYMCLGEFESLKAIYMVSPEFVPAPYACGMFKLEGSNTYFLLTEFRKVDKQPAESDELAPRLADMHMRSQSPTGKFGFHIQTYHGKIAQAVNHWDDSWCAVFSRHLGYIMELVKNSLKWPEFEVACELTLRKVVPRLLLPLQAEGRVLKPSLIHGDCWDGNTAMDAKSGHAFVFDACSFYGHNEYDIGNWRAPRHRLSKGAYITLYKRHFPVSEPAEDWDARNCLYSLSFNIGNIINIPGSQQRQVVYDDMTTLCKMFCPQDLETEMQKLNQKSEKFHNGSIDSGA